MTTLQDWADNWPNANVGILTEPSNVTIIDIDEPELLGTMCRRFGDTPLITKTPSGGSHLWYRRNGETSANRIDGLPVDIKAAGGMVVVPPSIRPTGPYAGGEYVFDSGGWEDLVQLPTIRPGSLRPLATRKPAGTRVGERNDVLFRFLLRQAPHCGNEDDLLDVANTWNMEGPEEPLSQAEIAKTVGSAWKCQSENRNWVGGSGVCQISSDLMERLISFSPRHGSDALALFLILRQAHAARDKRGEVFPVAPKAMALSGVLPWPPGRIGNALAGC